MVVLLYECVVGGVVKRPVDPVPALREVHSISLLLSVFVQGLQGLV